MYKFLKKIVCEIYNIVKKDIGIIDNKNSVLIYTDSKKTNHLQKLVYEHFNAQVNEGCFDEYSYTNLNLNNCDRYFILINGTDKEDLKYLQIVKNFISQIYIKQDFQNEKEYFIRTLLLNKLDTKEIEFKSKEFKIALDLPRIIILFEIPQTKIEEVKTFLTNKFKDSIDENYVVSVTNSELVILKTLKNNLSETELFNFFNKIIEEINQRFDICTLASCSNIITDFDKINISFKEASLALKIKKIFKTHDIITKYNALGKERLIYGVPVEICKIFINEVLQKNKIKDLDEETIETINKFFENNLNISETSRKLFIHRNTLVYRLEKIKHLTNLDIRIFEDATIFNLALMVQKYLNFISKNSLQVKGETPWSTWKTFVLDMTIIIMF